MLPYVPYIAILLSGFASLGYELCWIRVGSLLIGATPLALSIVVAVFFGAMAVGTCSLGLVSRRTDKPLLWYGILECAIGVVTAATPLLFSFGGEVYALAHQWAGANHALQIFLRSALVAAIISPPCVLTGGTLPLLCQFFINRRHADIRFAAGSIYAINTFGAFLGCMLCGIWFIPGLGVNNAIWFNSLLSLAVGTVIILLSLKHLELSPSTSLLPLPESAQRVPAPGAPLITGTIIYGLFFCAGFTALGYEILWVRYLSLIITSTVYTGIISLGAILLGISIGGVSIFFIKDDPEQDAALFGIANIFIAFCILLIIHLPVTAWDWIRGTQSLPMQSLLCLMIILIPSIASGVSFPLAYRLIAAHPTNSGRDFGYLATANTLGGIAGSLLVGFYLLPIIGMYPSFIILAVISLTIGFIVILIFDNAIALFHKRALVCVVTAAFFGITLSSTTRLPADFLAGRLKMIEFSEGISSFIAVIRRGDSNVLEIDRMWQGETQKGHQIMAAHIPMILHQDPKRVLVIGMGTGQTASRFLMYDIEQLDCVDIEKSLPGILRRHFEAAWLYDPRTNIITDDGRNFTANSKTSYDIVSIEVGQSFRPQVASFYTVDFYQDVKKRLTPNGLACQFVPVGFFTGKEFRSVIRSFVTVFPQSTLWFNKYAECLLIGSVIQQPMLSSNRLELLRSNADIHSDLNYSFDNRPWLTMYKQEVFAANYLMGPQTLLKLSRDASPYRDDKPVLEYQTARNYYSRSRYHDLIEKNLDDPETIFADKIRIASEIKIIQIREEMLHEALKEH